MRRREFLSIGITSAVSAACARRPPLPAAQTASPARAAVASSQVYATRAGLQILRAGGNAADAAVATAAALNVTEPTSTGLGGDCFALYYDSRTRGVTGLNGSGRSPAALSLDLLRGQGMTELPKFHGHTITVPGACAGWCDLAARHGRLPLSRTLEPAIVLAEQGFRVAPITAHFWERGSERLRSASGGRELTLDGRAPRAGELFRNPGLARTLRSIARDGKAAFYQGELARAIVQAVASAGGVMSLEDLASHASTFDPPISVTYRGVRVWECPPNGQGIAALIALNILEGFDLARTDPVGPDRFHLEIEAMRLAFADTRWFVSDPSVASIPVQELLSKDYAATRRRTIDPRRATASVTRGNPAGGSDTVYFCVVDTEGNACSFINSNYMGFGTAIVPAGFGFTLHNRGHLFSLDPSHPNALAPRKRPYHTIIPGMMTNADGSLYAPFGVMGGFMQPQGHVQVVTGLIDDGATPQSVLDRPRFCIEPVEGDSKIQLEEGLSPATVEELRARGHPVVPNVTGYARSMFGRGQIIRRHMQAIAAVGSDRRADGCAETL